MSKLSARLEDLPPPPPESMKQKATYWQYRAFWETVARLPEPVARRLPATLGAAWHGMASSAQKEQVRRNLTRVARQPDEAALDRLVADAYVSYARYWIDAFRLHTLSAEDVVARTTGEGLEHGDAMRDAGNGGIMATCHLGSWDIGALFTTQRNWGMSVVAEMLEPRRLFERFVWLRRQAGIDVYPLVRGGDMIDQMVGVIEAGGLATLLADRDLSRKGPIVEFFGEPCRLPAGTAVLARRTGRPVIAAAFVSVGSGWKGILRAPVDISGLSVEDGTQVVAHELEHIIGAYPEQWHVFVKNWLVDREPDHPLAKGSA